MGLFGSKKKGSKDTLYSCLGLKLNPDFVIELDRYNSIFNVIVDKVYTKEEIEQMTKALSQNGSSIEIWESFVWIDYKVELEFVTLLSTNYVTGTNFNGIVQFDIDHNVTTNNIENAFKYLKDLGFIYGSQFASIPENKVWKNVVEYVWNNFNAVLGRHYEIVNFSTAIMENRNTSEYISYVSLKPNSHH